MISWHGRRSVRELDRCTCQLEIKGNPVHRSVIPICDARLSVAGLPAQLTQTDRTGQSSWHLFKGDSGAFPTWMSAHTSVENNNVSSRNYIRVAFARLNSRTHLLSFSGPRPLPSPRFVEICSVVESLGKMLTTLKSKISWLHSRPICHPLMNFNLV